MPTKTVLLLRHAKSSWGDPSLPDPERPLNDRGRTAAKKLGKYMGKHKVIPDLVLTSPAVRARETIDLVLKFSRLQVELRQDERIYEAGPVRLLEVISQIEEDRQSVLFVGHNPGMEELLRQLTNEAVHMPTAALAKVTINAKTWSDVAQAKGTLEWFVRPKDLND